MVEFIEHKRHKNTRFKMNATRIFEMNNIHSSLYNNIVYLYFIYEVNSIF